MSLHSCSPLGKIRVAVIICCLVLILGIFGYAYLTDINNNVIEKDDIVANVTDLGDNDYGYTYISSYVKKYGIGNLNTYKLNSVENQLESDFYKELPEEKELAKTATLLFVENFYDTIDLEDKEAVTDAILKCLFASLGDPYAYYRTSEEFMEYIESLEGGDEFVGIGVLINQETLEILMVYKDSGADEAGILPKDIIYGVEDKTIENTPKEELLDMIKGEPETQVKVTVKRGNELLTFDVTRTVLTERTVLYEMTDNRIGYIQITQFLEMTSYEFMEGVDYCIDRGAVALVIDVRHNPGGLLNSVIEVIDYLAPDDPERRITSYTQAGDEYVYYTNDGYSVDVPIAVLCNEGTASAGELFTAAMRDYGEEGVLDTVIIGTNTYGKGVVQNSYTLYDSSGITYTIGYYNPPCDVNFDGIGVKPEIIVEEVAGKDAPLAKAREELLKMAKNNDSVEAYIQNAA